MTRHCSSCDELEIDDWRWDSQLNFCTFESVDEQSLQMYGEFKKEPTGNLWKALSLWLIPQVHLAPSLSFLQSHHFFQPDLRSCLNSA
jgi:hypothetical protein